MVSSGELTFFVIQMLTLPKMCVYLYLQTTFGKV